MLRAVVSRGMGGHDNPIKKYPRPLRTHQTGIDILHDPLWSKSSAFDYAERDRLGLRGLIPPVVRSIDGQLRRVMEHIRALPDNLSKAVYLQDLHNRNETLYHRVLVDHIEEVRIAHACMPSVVGLTGIGLCPGRSFGLHAHRRRGLRSIRTPVPSH